MAIRIKFTHPFNLLEQLIVWVGTLAGGFVPAILVGEAGAGDVISIAVWLVCTFASGFFLSNLLSPVSTMLYLAKFCLTKVSYTEAKELAFLFDGTLGGKWYPLSDLRKVPQDVRRQVLFEFAQRMKGFGRAEQYYAKKEEPPRQEQRHSSYSQDSRQESYSQKQNQNYSSDYISACSILDIVHGFSADQLKQKYRKQMKKYHPDIYSSENPNLRAFAEERARSINAAYEYLGSYYKE